MTPPPLAIAMLASCLLAPLVQYTLRRHLAPVPPSGTRRAFTQKDALATVLVGSGIPQAVWLLLSPIWPELLRPFTDLPALLVPTGVITLLFSIGSLVDWE